MQNKKYKYVEVVRINYFNNNKKVDILIFYKFLSQYRNSKFSQIEFKIYLLIYQRFSIFEKIDFII